MTQPVGAPVVVQEIDAGPGPALAVISAAEAAIAGPVLAAYTRWLARVASVLLATLLINPALIWSLIPSWNRRVDSLMKDLEGIARLGWEQARRDLGVGIPFDITNPVLQDQLRRTRNFMIQTPNEVYRMVINALDKNAGDPAAQRAAVENILNITGTANWPARAKTVAVTEVNRTFHFGSLALAMQVPGTIVKKWTAKEDKATRPTHAAADNQTRPLFQPFQVGMSSLMAPGDPS